MSKINPNNSTKSELGYITALKMENRSFLGYLQ